ncbi:MAG: elongation factor P [Candidatus Marinimicrobia bacterium]|nr:elongation factor P [Candidatus Neomarinimicrobiota bacterium]
MATTADIRTGLVIEYKGHRMKIVEFLHVKPGKGGAFIRTKLKNIVSGQVMDVTFRAGEKLSIIRLESHSMQYLYLENESFVFMNNESYEQIYVSKDLIADQMILLKEGTFVNVNLVGDEVIDITPPLFVELEVIETEPGLRGNTATGASKSAKVETGYTVSVPLFINIGDRIKIDTRTREYVERVK